MNDTNERLRREQNILERLDNVKRLIQMETTLLTVNGARRFTGYKNVDCKGQAFGHGELHELRDEIRLQLLSITALCYGDNPDLGEPYPMLEWNFDATEGSEHPADMFSDAWDKYLRWNA